MMLHVRRTRALPTCVSVYWYATTANLDIDGKLDQRRYIKSDFENGTSG